MPSSWPFLRNKAQLRERSDGGGGGGAASSPAGPAVDAGEAAAAAEKDEEAELLEDAAKAANDIAIVLQRLASGWETVGSARD